MKKLAGLMAVFMLAMTMWIPFSSAAGTTGVTLDSGKNKYTATNAVLYVTINNPNNATITDVGIVVKKGESTVKKHTEKCNSAYKTKSSVPMWFDLNKELNLQLLPQTQYTYEMFAYIGGKKYTAGGSFKTKSLPSVTLNTNKNDVSQSNAVLYATVNNPGNQTITDVGITIQQNGKTVGQCKETCSSAYKTKSSVPVWYDVNKELSLTLQSGMTYTYRIYAVVGGKTYSAEGKFSTPPATVGGTSSGAADSPFTSAQYSAMNADKVINFKPNDDYKLGDGACNLFSMTCLVRRMQALHSESLLSCQTSLDYNKWERNSNNDGTYYWYWDNWKTSNSWNQKIYNNTGYKTSSITSPGKSADAVAGYLEKYPAGIVCYFYGKNMPAHSVLITRIVDGSFYCIDYYKGVKNMRTIASETLLEKAPFINGCKYPKDYASLFQYLQDVVYICE